MTIERIFRGGDTPRNLNVGRKTEIRRCEYL